MVEKKNNQEVLGDSRRKKLVDGFCSIERRWKQGTTRTKEELHSIIIEDAKEIEKIPPRGRSSNSFIGQFKKGADGAMELYCYKTKVCNRLEWRKKPTYGLQKHL